MTIRAVTRTGWAAIALAALACSGGSGTGPAPPPAPVWVAVDTLDVASTRALTMDPGGEWLLVVEGDGQGTGYRLFDPASGRPLGPARPLGGVSDGAVSLDGSIGAIVGAGLPEATLVSISAGDERARTGATGAIVERHPDRDVFYVAGETGVFRIDRNGALVRAAGMAGTASVTTLGVAADGSVVFAFVRGDPTGRIAALDAETMAVRADLSSPLEVQVFVPLDGASRALAIGTPAERPFRGPVWTAEVDAGAARVGPVRSIADGIRAVGFSPTSWARVDPATLLVPSTYGPIAVDPGTGEARLLPEHVFEGLDPCCAIAWDPRRSRLFATSHVPSRESNGRIVAYERRGP